MSEDVKLIELVRNRSFLYDTSQKEYRDNGMRENGWKSIGMQMGISSEECQKRWRFLRDKFAREKKIIDSKIRSGSAANVSSKWSLYNQMQFLYDHIRIRRNYRNITRLNHIPHSEEFENLSSQVQVYELPQGIEGNICDNETMTNHSGSEPSSSYQTDESMIMSDDSVNQNPSTISSTGSCNENDKRRLSRKRKSDVVDTIISVLRQVATAIETPNIFNDINMDSETAYCISLIPRLKSLNKHAKSQARIKIETILSELENQD